MKKSSRILKFKDVFERIDRPLMVNDSELYNCVGVRWHGEGTFIREEKIGYKIKKKKQHIIKEGDIVYNKLFAWKGSFAIANPTVDDCIVSDKFPTYLLKNVDVDKEYLGFFFKSRSIEKQAEDLSTGMAAISKFTLNPPKFFELEIPVPSMEQQHVVVKVMKEALSRINEISRMRENSEEYIEHILKTETMKMAKKFTKKALSEVLENQKRQLFIDDSKIYKQVTVKMENRGVILRKEENGLNIKSKKQYIVKPGDLIFSKIDARNGAIGFVPSELEDAIVSADFPVFHMKENITREYLNYIIKTRKFREECVDKSYGTTNRKRLKTTVFLDIQIPVPPLDIQEKIVARLDVLNNKVTQLRRILSDSEQFFKYLPGAFIESSFNGKLMN